jgi:hypothetical protein
MEYKAAERASRSEEAAAAKICKTKEKKTEKIRKQADKQIQTQVNNYCREEINSANVKKN